MKHNRKSDKTNPAEVCGIDEEFLSDKQKRAHRRQLNNAMNKVHQSRHRSWDDFDDEDE